LGAAPPAPAPELLPAAPPAPPAPAVLAPEAPLLPALLPELPAPWWRVFDDPALDTLIGEALERNPDIEVAAARVAEARAIARAASAERLPSLGLEAGVERSRESVLTLPFAAARTTQTAYYLQGAVRYELDLWGRYAHASEAARARLLASEFDQEAVRLSLSGEVARGWYALKAATEQLANAREARLIYRSSADDAKAFEFQVAPHDIGDIPLVFDNQNISVHSAAPHRVALARSWSWELRRPASAIRAG